MERRIVFATGNQNKMKEIRMILEDLGMPIYSMKELGIEEDIVEDGETFEANAEIKARAIAKHLPNDIILADDSGLEIDYLDKAPGVYSARFAGENADDAKNNEKLLKLLGVFRRKKDFNEQKRADKCHVYKKCPSCKAVLRLPKRPGVHKTVCPRCGREFTVRVRK